MGEKSKEVIFVLSLGESFAEAMIGESTEAKAGEEMADLLIAASRQANGSKSEISQGSRRFGEVPTVVG